MHEGLINIGYKDGIKNEEGKKLAHKIMQFIHSVLNEFIERDKVACGVEFAPNENAGVKLARHDIEYGKKLGVDVFVQGDKESGEVYTTSGCMLPFSEEDFLEQVENSAEFQAYGTSGSILHNFVEAKLEPKQLARHIKNIFKKPVIYITITPTLTSCMSCGQEIVAEDGKNIHTCPVCGSDDIATFSRVIGYTKMISRKGIKVNENGKYEGEYNFWSNSRRRDWNIRKRIKEEDLVK
jgi:ribonucleoside-triphosphate reductase